MTAPSLDSLDIISAAHYGANGYPHEEWARLRREAPVFRCRQEGFDPFWAITKHADLLWVSKQPDLFLNRPRMAMFHDSMRPRAGQPPQGQGLRLRMLLNMDPPEHRRYRKVAYSWFTPRALQRLSVRIEEIARRILDDIANDGELSECDFVTDVAARLPLKVIAEILGVPEKDEDLVLQLSNTGIGAQDPEFSQGYASPREARRDAFRALFGYFGELAEARRKEPKEDLTSLLANVAIDGKPIATAELLSYYGLIAVAGHETTRNATSGGMFAMLENPEQWTRLQKDLSLLDPAVEEIIRWTSPVIQFSRTAVQEVELRGHHIHPGDTLVLFYPSANRDEEIFDEPFQFRIDRSPNPHLAFGIGEHFCLGANLARLELRVIFRQLAERLEHLEPAGPVEFLHSSFVGGVKHLPIRYRLRPSVH